MSTLIARDLNATGFAPVICVLKQGDAATAEGPDIGRLADYFVDSAMSQPGAVARESAVVRTLGLRATRAHEAAEDPTSPTVQYYPNLGVAFGVVTPEGLAALRQDDAVAKVTGVPPLSLIRPERARSAGLTRKVEWGIAALGVPDLWAAGLTGDGVLVGHLDTGVDGAHPALRGAVASFAEFDALDRFGRAISPPPEPHDSGEHGTHTAAIIAGRAVRGKHVGVAPKAMLASALVIEGGPLVARVLGGMDWAVGQGVRVMNLSLGFRGWWTDFVPIMQILRERNVLPVIAVGNEGPGTSRSPGNYVEVLSVGAVDKDGAVISISSSQRFKRKKDALVPDVVAPGEAVISARPGGGFQAMNGTSMAAPHVSGLAALLFESRPDASASDVERAILRSCERPPGMAVERGNRGIPSGPRALELLSRQSKRTGTIKP